MVKKTCDKELNEIQKLKMENKQLRDKNSKLSHFIKHNRQKLSNPDSAQELLNKCSEDEEVTPISKNNSKKHQEDNCPKCKRRKLLSKFLTMPNNTVLSWTQCPDQACAFKSERVSSQREKELSCY